ncbi:SMC-Scp complex subunit ScpB [Candidatus Wolfebacteria bacterium CG10_big_fil_rev_8_21_14_0_10_31_9]|uniref:SMC-Scp complex subunit ScpB n=1 Tax=Candidatus Wolfebacteria bacterium CG10_big_fil_rev_8_21_14_0_10_31_9 TaxID=1975070 RepID=A0A2H0RCE6_9BACT|nr:MAG: SMC-Scp complex subunit ScpB [Candidatus Wolfebacteria bacterium CG10_big_fil_rev_8_21_14_0_10_31_9]
MGDFDNRKLLGAIEAIFFVYGEPLDIKRISKIVNTSEDKVKGALAELEVKYSMEERGLKLIVNGDKFQLATKAEFSELLESFVKEEFDENLTPAALETLSLIAFLGPISRPRIDYFRGVNSSYSVRNLLTRGLIEKSSDLQNQHNILYRTSLDLLKYLGISKIEDLPDYQKYQALITETN